VTAADKPQAPAPAAEPLSLFEAHICTALDEAGITRPAERWPVAKAMSKRMLSDKTFRKKVIENIQDPVVKAFWVKEFASYADKFASEAVSPIQNKVGQFLSSSLIRNIVGQVHSSIDLRKVMDEGRILIMNLSKGRIGEDNSELLGSMMITKIQLAAMSRVNIPEEERRDFYLYVDEFQNFATNSFANILSEARKYRLNLIMGHQYIEQLSEEVKAAVFGNVGTLAVFRVGATDAEELVKEFAPIFTEEDLVNLPKYNIVLKLMIDGVASDPFSARGLPPLKPEELTGNEEAVINNTRSHYANARAEVEAKIMRWHTEDDAQTIKATPVAAASRPPVAVAAQQALATPNYPPSLSTAPVATSPAAPPRAPVVDPIYLNDAICARCGKGTKVSFKPDGIRPVYCKECLALLREEKQRETAERKRLKQAELSHLTQTPSSNRTEPTAPTPTISLRDIPKVSPTQPAPSVSPHPETGSLKPGQPITF
jgi:CxxC-x17-CxxC domain-containing protein